MAKTKLEYITLSALPVDIDFSGENQDSNSLPTFKMVAYTGCQVNAPVSRHPVIIDLKGLKIPIQNIPVRMQHDPEKGIGHTTKIEIKNGIVLMEGVISRDTEWARDVITSAKNKFPWRVSIGFSIEEYQFVNEDESAEVNSRKFKGLGYVLRKTILKETSFVDVGADNATSAIIKFSGENPFINLNDNQEI
ncbi:MAG: HK97 family phage prohead protease, partial [Planctomycetaceae bacterium]|nr:HK97 family phage prohead protease [Planctomycetaceae bacterium]